MGSSQRNMDSPYGVGGVEEVWLPGDGWVVMMGDLVGVLFSGR